MTRKKNESICIGDDIIVKVVDFKEYTAPDGHRTLKVKLGIHAPDEVRVDRMEIRTREDYE